MSANGSRSDYKLFAGNSNRKLAEAIAAALGRPLSAGHGGPLLRRRDPGGDRREHPRAGHLHHPVHLLRRQRQPDGAAHHDRRAQARVGRHHQRGHPLLRLRPPGPQGGLAQPHHRQAGGRPARGGRRHPRGLHGHARRADPGLLQHPLRPPLRRAGAARPHAQAASRAKADELVIVSPDAGGVERARAYSKRLGASLCIVDKRRLKANVAEVLNVIGDVAGKSACSSTT